MSRNVLRIVWCRRRLARVRAALEACLREPEPDPGRLVLATEAVMAAIEALRLARAEKAGAA
jgi:hypothetical protein